ncbi:hypothetical protein [Tolypothrix tenuis]
MTNSITYYLLPITHYPLPITNYHAQCPMPHAQQSLILFQPAENL